MASPKIKPLNKCTRVLISIFTKYPFKNKTINDIYRRAVFYLTCDVTGVFRNKQSDIQIKMDTIILPTHNMGNKNNKLLRTFVSWTSNSNFQFSGARK